MCTPNRLHMQVKFKSSVRNSERPQIPLWFLSLHSLSLSFCPLYLSLFKTNRLPKQPAHYNFQLNSPPLPYLSPSLFEEASYKVDRLREGVEASKKLQARVSFTKLGPSVSYSAFHLLPIRREITCTVFIALSKPFEVFLLHNLAQCKRLKKCSPKQHFYIFTYQIHAYT